jgi:hypothetical protein
VEDLSLHILDVVENSTNAGATFVEIHIAGYPEKDLIEIVIRDNGKGMDREMLAKVLDPFTTTRTTRRVGLGLPMLQQAAREAGGDAFVTSEPGHGTEVKATFQASHIDRKPLGDMGATMVSLVSGNPEVDFLYECEMGEEMTTLDTRLIRSELEGVLPMNHPQVLSMIKDLFSKKSQNGGEQ